MVSFLFNPSVNVSYSIHFSKWPSHLFELLAYSTDLILVVFTNLFLINLLDTQQSERLLQFSV